MRIRQWGLRSPRRRRQWRRPDVLDVARWWLMALELIGMVITICGLFVLGAAALAGGWWHELAWPAAMWLIGGGALVIFVPIAIDEVAMWQRRRRAGGSDEQA